MFWLEDTKLSPVPQLNPGLSNLISLILSQDSDFDTCNDLNNDNQINISDIISLVNMIIS